MKKLMLAFAVFAAVLGARAELPEGYVQLEWIESTDSQYVNTGVKASSTLQGWIDCQLTQARDSGYSVLGNLYVRGTTADQRDWRVIALNGSGAQSIFDCGSARCSQKVNAFPKGTRVVAGFGTENGSIYLAVTNQATGVQLASANAKSAGSISAQPISLFGCVGVSASQSNMGTAAICPMRIYRCRLTEVVDGKRETVRDFVPCLRVANGDFGLYDTVEGKFYANAGTGTFLSPIPALPAAYQRLDWIESDGSQYIDLGLVATKTLQAKMDFTAWDEKDFFFGMVNGEDDDWRLATTTSGAKILFDRCATSDEGWNSRIYTDLSKGILGVRSLAEFGSQDNGTTLFVKVVEQATGDVLVNATKAAGTRAPTGAKTISLFGRPRAVHAAKNTHLRIYSLHLTDLVGGTRTVIRDLVPCRVCATGRVGLYDCVTGAFYANGNPAVGNVSGSDGVSENVELPWIESDGSQVIDSEINASSTLTASMDFIAYDQPDFLIGTLAGGDNADWRLFSAKLDNVDHNILFDCGSARIASGKNLAFGTRYVADFGRLGSKVFLAVTNQATGAQVVSKTANSSGSIASNPVTLFGRTTAKSRPSMRLYSLQLRNSTDLVRDFVPSRERSTGRVGLYDKVSGTYFFNIMTNLNSFATAEPAHMAEISPVSWNGYSVRKARAQVVVTDAASGAVLVEGRDYELDFEDNDRPGTAAVTARGLGDYAAYFERRTFEIVPALSAEVRPEGKGLVADVTFPAADVPRGLFVAAGTTDGSGLTNGWASVTRLATVPAGETSATGLALPAEVGYASTAVRFFLETAESPDVGEYVQDGLVLCYDGIENAGRGLAHADGAASWKNLGTAGAAYDLDLTKSWLEDGADGMSVVSRYGTDKSAALQRFSEIDGIGCNQPLTCECTMKNLGWRLTDDYGNIQGVLTTPMGTVCYRLKATSSATEAATSFGFGPLWSYADLRYVTMSFDGRETSDIHTLAAPLALGSRLLYVDGMSRDVITDMLSGTEGYVTRTATYNFFANARADLQVYAIRLYGRRLSEAEILRNQAIDAVRFKGEKAHLATVAMACRAPVQVKVRSVNGQPAVNLVAPAAAVERDILVAWGDTEEKIGTFPAGGTSVTGLALPDEAVGKVGRIRIVAADDPSQTDESESIRLSPKGFVLIFL